MANPVTAAGDNGVAGDNYAVTGGDAAIRASVARTQRGYGSAVAASSVASYTKNLRFAYGEGQEADAPAQARV
jgi:hypothetical protein